MIQYLPAIANVASTITGFLREGKTRRQMSDARQKMKAENESLYNQDYYSDFTKRADSQAIIKQLKDELKTQNERDQNTAAVTGATPEAMNAAKQRQNKAISDVYSNISARGQAWKDRAKDRYMTRKNQLDDLEYNDMSATAESANNMMYNGIGGLAATDWSSMFAQNYKPTIQHNAANDLAYKPRTINNTSGVSVTGGPVKPTKFN